jgi:hypothetical protein
LIACNRDVRPQVLVVVSAAAECELLIYAGVLQEDEEDEEEK